MRYWPVGDFHDDTVRVLGVALAGYEDPREAAAVIASILRQQTKPHHVSYRVEAAEDLTALMAKGVLV